MTQEIKAKSPFTVVFMKTAGWPWGLELFRIFIQPRPVVLRGWLSPLTSTAEGFAHGTTALWVQPQAERACGLSVTAPFLWSLSPGSESGIGWEALPSPQLLLLTSLEHKVYSFCGLLPLTVLKVSKPPLTRRLLSNRESQRWDILSFLQQTGSHTDQGQIQLTVGTSN